MDIQTFHHFFFAPKAKDTTNGATIVEIESTEADVLLNGETSTNNHNNVEAIEMSGNMQTGLAAILDFGFVCVLRLG